MFMTEANYSDQMAAEIEGLRARRRAAHGGPEVTLAQRRASFSPALVRHPLPHDVNVRRVSADGVDGYWLTPNGADPHRTLMYVHGGGWALGDLASHGELAARIAREGRARVFFPEYRRTPEHPFPAAVHDVASAWSWLHRESSPDMQLALAGDSAGGNLALTLVLALRDRGRQLPRRLGLLSPVTDLTGSGASMTERATHDPVFEPDTVRALERQYLADTDPRTPAASPLFAELAGLPPMLIQTGDAEVLLSDSERLAEAARRAGADVTLHVGAGLPHVYPAMAGTPEAAEASRDMGRFLFS